MKVPTVMLAMDNVVEGQGSPRHRPAIPQVMMVSLLMLALDNVVEGEWSPHRRPAIRRAQAVVAATATATVKVLLLSSAPTGVRVALVGRMKVTFMMIPVGTRVMEHSKDTATSRIATASRMRVCNNGAKVACHRPVVHVGVLVVVVPQGRGPRRAAARAKAVAVAGLAKTEEMMMGIGLHLGACALLHEAQRRQARDLLGC